MSRCTNKNNLKKKIKQNSEETPDILVEKFPLHLTNKQIALCQELQQQSAKTWNAVCNIHRTIYGRYRCWLEESAIKSMVKGKYGIHSQSVQAVVETYFECCDRTRELHRQGYTDWKYPYRKKHYFTVTWKELGITKVERVLRLSNGRGREPLIVKIPQRLANKKILQAQLVWHRNSYWLHITIEKPALPKVQGDVIATIDPGEIHAVAITDGKGALVISGRLLRSLYRLRNKELRKFQRAISKTKRGSRKRKKLLIAKYCFLNRIERQVEHIMHTISCNTARWCIKRNVKKVYTGNPAGVRQKDCGRKHNQRMSQWPFGRLREMLEYKLNRYGIELKSVDERGTSGTCPQCTEYTKQTGRIYKCPKCGFTGAHRDVVGASGILDKSINGNFTQNRELPEKVDHLRPKVLTTKKAA